MRKLQTTGYILQIKTPIMPPRVTLNNNLTILLMIALGNTSRADVAPDIKQQSNVMLCS
jgi:hypothetical protein